METIFEEFEGFNFLKRHTKEFHVKLTRKQSCHLLNMHTPDAKGCRCITESELDDFIKKNGFKSISS